MIFLPVRVEPVKATLSTPERVRAAPVSPVPKTVWKTGCSGTASAKRAASQLPTAGVYSLGLNTTALPAASAYPIEPSGVSTGEFHGPITPTTPCGRDSTRDEYSILNSEL